MGAAMDVRERALRDALAGVEARLREETAAADKAMRAGWPFEYAVAMSEIGHLAAFEARVRQRLALLPASRGES